MKKTETTEEVSSHLDGKSCWEPRTASAHPDFRIKRGGSDGKNLRFIGAERKSQNNVDSDRGQETKWEISSIEHEPKIIHHQRLRLWHADYGRNFRCRF
jgi:hypothetical protein